MNKKIFVCSKASLAIPSQINSIANNKFQMITGFVKCEFDIIKGDFSESAKNTDAGLLVTQTLEIEARLLSGKIPETPIVMVELSLSEIGESVWGSQERPVTLERIQNNMPSYKLTLQRLTNKFEF